MPTVDYQGWLKAYHQHFQRITEELDRTRATLAALQAELVASDDQLEPLRCAIDAYCARELSLDTDTSEVICHNDYAIITLPSEIIIKFPYAVLADASKSAAYITAFKAGVI